MALHKETKLSPAKQAQFKALLQTTLGAAQLKVEKNCLYRMDGAHPESGGKVLIKQYRNGTFTLQTQSDADLGVLLDNLGLKGFAVSAAPSPAGSYYAYGADESGKGDYFGPLVTACCYVPQDKVFALQQMGVTDSKLMTDAKIKQITPDLVDLLGIQHVAFLVLMPTHYNAEYARLKAKGQHLNHLLSLMHAKTVAGLIEKQGGIQNNDALMVDQFTQGPHLLDAMNIHAPALRVGQATKAETSHPSVAAASVIARYKFLQSMAKLNHDTGLQIPLGASAKVVTMAKKVYREEGMAGLESLAKLHFKTTLDAIR